MIACYLPLKCIRLVVNCSDVIMVVNCSDVIVLF